MSHSAIFDTTLALRDHLLSELKSLDKSAFHLSIPDQKQMMNKRVLLYPFHLEVNAELRNSRQLASAGTALAGELTVLPLNIRYLVAVFSEQGVGSAEPDELLILGRIMQRLESEPQVMVQASAGVDSASLQEQLVSFRPEHYPMEELSRIWSLFPQEYYRTSVVYTASPVHIESQEQSSAERVLQGERRQGLFPPLRRGQA